MRVMIDATYAERSPFSGAGVYVERIVHALGRVEEVEVEPVVNPRSRPSAGSVTLQDLAGDHWWTTFQLPRLARRAGADVLHHPLPAFTRWTSRPQVVTVHDLAFQKLPQHFDRGFRRYARVSHRSAALAAQAVVCVSEATALDVRVLWGVAPERTVVALLGPGQEVPQLERQPRHFLYVGDDEPHKNLPVLLAAYAGYRGRAERPAELILAGAATGRGEGVRIEQRPTREQLAELYAGALALIHPSLHEGFGLTALEAMSLGVPVVASAIPALREICGGAALYADPRDPRAFTTAMIQLATQPRLRERLADHGARQAARFSWDACARAHVEAYELARGLTPRGR
ncbi:MAG TPA: glycosyltransferase family 1 protein [Solirubrobacteraceae bacterium]|nr:glycosyltransferase family 1 protein [Solirubrobacteraceae bacterium]